MKKITPIFVIIFMAFCSLTHAQKASADGITIRVFGKSQVPDSMAIQVDTMKFMVKSLLYDVNTSKEMKKDANWVITKTDDPKYPSARETASRHLDLLIRFNQSVIKEYNLAVELADMTLKEYSADLAKYQSNLKALKKNNQPYLQSLNDDIAWAKQKLAKL